MSVDRMKIDKEKWFAAAWQFIKFGIVGFTNTLVHLAVYYLLIRFRVHYLAANTAAFVISVLNAYLLNSRFVFRAAGKRSHAKSVAKMFVTYGATFLLSTLLMYIYVDRLGINEKLAPLLNVFVTTPVNFLLNKFWTFRVSPGKGD
mgnify:CR=1 FL=1